ncbi:unnamed protein product [Calypogeia fissa]
MDLNYESLVSSVDVQAARARARSLHCARHGLENSVDKTLAWDARYLQTPYPISAVDEFVSQRLENIRESIKGHHRSTITPRPAYRRSLNAANCELMSFREKFEEWKMTYDREIGKTKASLASMTPTLQGLGLAARFHKIAGRAAESLSGGTPSKGETTPCNTVASTPRTPSDWTSTLDCRESGSEHSGTMEPSLQPLQHDTDELLSSRDEYPDYLDDEPPILSERSGKLAEVKEDIGVLTTIIEKKIFATHVNPPNPVRDSESDVDNVDAEEDVVVDLCAWSEGALTARTIKMSEDIVDAQAPPPDHDDVDSSVSPAAADSVVVEGGAALSTSETLIPYLGTPQNHGHAVTVPGKINYKTNLGRLDHYQPRPVNLRDNLIILAKQKGFTVNVGTPVNEAVATAQVPNERERALALLRKMYAPSKSTPIVIQKPLIESEEPKATTKTLKIEQSDLTVSESRAESVSPTLDEREASAAAHLSQDLSSEEATVRNQTKVSTTGNIPNRAAAAAAGDVTRPVTRLQAIIPSNQLARLPPANGELERESSIFFEKSTSPVVEVDEFATAPVVPNEDREVRELVIGSYRNGKPASIYEGVDAGIAI